MKSLSKLLAITVILFPLSGVLVGCAEEGNTVIEAPDEAVEQAEIEAMQAASEETTDE